MNDGKKSFPRPLRQGKAASSGALIRVGAPVIITSPVATVDFVAGFDATGSEYELHFQNVVGSAAAFLAMQTSGDGVTFDSGASDYKYAFTHNDASSGTVASATASNGAARIALDGLTTMSATASFGGATGRIEIPRPYDATVVKPFLIRVAYPLAQIGLFAEAHGYGARASVGAINGLRFLMSTGTINSGFFQLYRVGAP